MYLLRFNALGQAVRQLSSMNQVVLLVVLGTTIWVGVDASRKDFARSSFARSTALWVFGCLARWIVVFPIYLVQRARCRPSTDCAFVRQGLGTASRLGHPRPRRCARPSHRQAIAISDRTAAQLRAMQAVGLTGRAAEEVRGNLPQCGGCSCIAKQATEET